MRALIVLIVFSVAALGQRHKIEEVDDTKPEGKLLQQVIQESDAAKKTALMEQFVQQFPKVEGTAWVLEQLQAVYVKANDYDKIIAAGDKLVALDPEDPEAALQNLKAAEAKKDLEGVRKWAGVTSANARKMAAAPQPKEAEQVDGWKQEVAYAKQVDAYTDYALYRVIAEARDPKVTIDFSQELEKHNPQSEYLPRTQTAIFIAYRQTGANDKAMALAEKVLATDQTNEDMLLVVTDNYLQTKKEPEKVHAYSAKLVDLMAAKPKPEGMSDADWASRRGMITGVAHYMNGKLYYGEKRYPQADKELRAALPLVGSNQAMKAEVLFELGFANYKMEKPQEAANFYRDCAAMNSPFQADAAKSLQGIKTQFRGIK
jgi:tetratricopeptide (TPR) repeat protein